MRRVSKGMPRGQATRAQGESRDKRQDISYNLPVREATQGTCRYLTVSHVRKMPCGPFINDVTQVGERVSDFGTLCMKV